MRSLSPKGRPWPMNMAVNRVSYKLQLSSAPFLSSPDNKIPGNNNVFQFFARSSRISVVIFAVLLSMAETEQYFSSDNLTASSTALRETGPDTVKISLIEV